MTTEELFQTLKDAMSEYIYKPPPALPPGSMVIAYLRDSGGPNQQESISQQQRVVSEYCMEHRLILNRVYSDTASGRKTKKREEFLEMFNTVMTTPEGLRPAGLILWAYSRFSRDIVDFNYYLYGLMKQGLCIHSLTEEIPEGLAGQIVLSVKAYTNADFSVQLGKNIKRGIADRVREGYCNGGQAPKGYRVVRELHDSRRNGQPRIGVKWERDPVLAPLVIMAWEMRAQGKSLREIIEATGGKVYTAKNSWVSHFQNKSYLGTGKAGGLEIPDHHEPLISWELWDAVQKLHEAHPLSGRRGNPLHHRRLSHPSLLSGLSFCFHCGSAMVFHTAKKYRSYICGSHDRKESWSECPQGRCVNAGKAEAAVLDTVLNKILSPAFSESILDETQKQIADTSKIDREIDEVNNLLIVNTRAINRLLKLAEGAGDIDELAARLKELKREEIELAARMKRLKAELDAEIPQLTPEALSIVFLTWRTQIQNAVQSNDVLKVKNMLACFVDKIELDYNRAVIHYTYPLDLPENDFLRKYQPALRPQES